MSHRIEIQNLGPILHCNMELKALTILTGPQSSGKSTIAKAIYFFRTVKDEILDTMMQGGPKDDENLPLPWVQALKSRLRGKFLQIFGTTWAMPKTMQITYCYDSDTSIRAYLTPTSEDKNFLDFEFSPKLQDFISVLDDRVFSDISSSQKSHEQQQLNNLFCDDFETVFIPAGRNLITLLSTQLNYIFTSMDPAQIRSLDYCTRQYVNLILKNKARLTSGMSGALFENELNGKHKNRPSISKLMELAGKVLNGTYRYEDAEERMYLPGVPGSQKYVKINFTSSGQQETVWIFNLLFVLLLDGRKVFLIVEEPESHLYPDAQKTISEALALFSNQGNTELVTTHSPYVLGAFNNFLLAQQLALKVGKSYEEKVKKALHKRFWVSPECSTAFFVSNGEVENILDTSDGIILIENEKIDGASLSINETSDKLLELHFEVNHIG